MAGLQQLGNELVVMHASEFINIAADLPTVNVDAVASVSAASSFTLANRTHSGLGSKGWGRHKLEGLTSL
jgi:hypothetical protein